MTEHVENLQGRSAKTPQLSELQQVILFRTELPSTEKNTLETYGNFLENGRMKYADSELLQAQGGLAPEDVLNLQFTSGIACPTSIPHED